MTRKLRVQFFPRVFRPGTLVFMARASGLACGFLLLTCPLQQICGAEKSPSPMETFMLQRGYRPIHAERNIANQFLIR